MKAIVELITQHKQGNPVGIYSVCSAHPLVIEAALRQAKKDGTLALIEATSNQVNQFGGYTGMTPKDFVAFVGDIAANVGLNPNQILLGGDHLGPNCWQSLTAKEAMDYSETLIFDYVAAGFRKIHLDCSMPCADDETPLQPEIIAERAARLCVVAESAWREVGGEAPVYVVGTEVPVPGGAQHALEDDLAVTLPDDAHHTISVHQQAWQQAGLTQVWQRVVGLVVQPGVEFDHHKVLHYQPEKATQLSEVVNDYPHLVFEAHSTDYQIDTAYHQLVRDHYAILKVGPALTYALREALFALDKIEQEWLGVHQSSHLRATLDQIMRENPEYWRPYYQEIGHQQYLDCAYSLSDRIRYYWPHPTVAASVSRLFDNLTTQPAPTTLVSQYLPEQAKAIARGEISAKPTDMVVHKVMEVTQAYANACYANKFDQDLSL